jgi:hypothetical protein
MGRAKLDQDQIEEMVENGEIVYSVYWDSEGPGAGADVEAIYKYNRKYCLRLSFEDDVLVYDSLGEALDAGELFLVSEATVSIESTEIPSEELIKKLTYSGGENHKFLINHEEFLINKNQIIRLDSV